MKITLIACIFILCVSIEGDAEKIGVNNGLLGDNLPPQEEVVSLMKMNNIGKYRIYKQEPTVFKAFANSDIEIIVGVANFDLQRISSDEKEAMKWVAEYVKPYFPATNIKYIAVGNEVLGKAETAKYVGYLLPAMINIQNALQKANLQDKIKVSTALAARDLIEALSFQAPSKGTFTEKVENDTSAVLKFLEHSRSPFLANVFPFFIYNSSRDSYSLDYALFKPTAPVVKDGNKIYKNLFDAMIDTLYSAMESMGYSNIPIVVTATGWPSKGNDVATIQNAKSYNNNLIKHVLSKAGTPKRPGQSPETCIFALFNENQKPGDETERNFGLFYPNKKPVYPVQFSV
ncbi:hypothetical protein SUGI_0326530 [Cryptomeria japonica]|nr:hypothetical protein SUGI_0326530 [Cryptomeria japonica]